MRLGVSVAALAALAGAAAGQGSSCFVPNSTARHLLHNGVNDTYRPCSPLSEGHSMCCNEQPGDQCQPNGLCLNARVGWLWRESCTDPTWQSPRCLKLCINGEADTAGISSAEMDVRITECPDGSLCCGAGSRAFDCCREGAGKRIVNGQVVDASASSSAGGSGSSVDMRVVGGSVAGAVVAGVLALAVAFYWYKRRKRRAGEAAGNKKSTAGEMRQGHAAVPTELPPDSLPPAELPPDAYPRAEAPSDQR